MPSALLVDVENVVLGLGGAVGEAFATEPSRWVRWLADGGDGGPRRRFAVQRCYLGGEGLHRFARPFADAGFEVSDCPAVTAAGKNSADICLVVDAMAALHGPVAIEDFVVVSADADVVPLLRHLRTWGRRRTMVAGGPTAAACAAVVDRLVTAEELARVCGAGTQAPAAEPVPTHVTVSSRTSPEVLSPSPAVPRQPGPTGPGDDADRVLDVVLDHLRGSREPVPGAYLSGLARAAVPALSDGRWFGHVTFKRFLAARAPHLEWTLDGHVSDRRAEPRAT